MLSLLDIYENDYGQLLNKEKKSIFFSSNTPMDVMNTITSIDGIRTNGYLEKYLGLPVFLVRKKSMQFQFLLDITWARMSNCKTKFLTGVGKKIILKDFL